MKYIDYVQLNPLQRAGFKTKEFFANLPKNFVKVMTVIGMFFVKLGKGIGKGFAGYFTRFGRGDWATKLSYIIMGLGNMVRGQIGKGLIFLATEVLYILFMINFGWGYLQKFPTLGTVEPGTRAINPATGRMQKMPGDNSMLILLYGVMVIVVTVIFFIIYISNTKSAYKAQQTVAEGRKPVGFFAEMKEFLDSKFHVTLLAFPTLTISIFTILPLIFMILIAFTNYDSDHNELAHLFTWTGFQTFSDVFSTTGGGSTKSMGETFLELTKWTLIWAVCATVLNYILGMVVALMINKKDIKLKALWRTLFVVTVAVPQFVSLLLMSQMLNYNDGAINVLLKETLHLIPEHIHFLDGDPWVARLTVIIVNCWVGIPYTILITSGILMNIPADLYESATIDGAGPVRSFFSITLPYMLFVTTPYLITSFVGNINNFNVIYLLTANSQNTNDLAKGAGYTDLLVTWLFKLTMSEHDYNLAAAIGILVFIVCATISLLTFNLTKSAKNEEEFS